MSFREILVDRASKAGLTLPAPVTDGLVAYFELLRKWNRTVSLTSLPVEEAGEEAIDRILIEPVLACRYLRESDALMLDVGSGGGSPAIPMKLASPGLSLRMVESKARKAAFLREIVRTMQLERTTVDAVRFEELHTSAALRGAFDVVTLRAVRIDKKTVAGLQSLIRPGGYLFLFGTTSLSPPDLNSSGALSFVGSHVLLSERGSHLRILQRVAPE